MFVKKGVSHGGLPRNKTIRAIVRRRLKATSLKGIKSQAQISPNSRTDEDSGFGGDSFGAELSMDYSPARHSNSSLSSQQETTISSVPSCSSMGSSTSSSFSEVMLPRFGVSEELFGDSTVDLCPKRLRLDMTEEANELPEGNSSPPQRPEEGPKIVSFKNVPGLIFPAAVQVQPATLVSISPHQPIQQPKQVVVEHLIKQKLVATCKATSKVDKLPKKKGKGHLLEGHLPSRSSDGTCELQLLTQPEGQHRARYQTEGSRGAVKDRVGTGHPCVKLKGYNKEAVLQVFVASDGAQGGSVGPHLFYQACKVSGKNSTPCNEERIHGTTVLEIALQPEKDMTVSCDCVGILKERNVDVEQRMKSFVSRGKKKSTKCRLVFRAKVILESGAQEILQVVSQPISCTQPPGIPEISRKSRSSCSVEGNEEMFVIGKNFYKDTEVVFREITEQDEVLWSSTVIPEKDYLQSSHLICQIPPYRNSSVSSELEVQVLVVSCNKTSDPHPFTYLPRKKETKEPQTEIQRQQIPKGVSPNAVKLNELYAESGGGLSFSSKEYCHLNNASTMNSMSRNGTIASSVNKERAMIPPLQVNRILAAVKPQVQTIANSVPKFTQKNILSNTFTTATVVTPKSSPNSAPSVAHVVSSGGPEGREERENVLENLIQMLKLLKCIPGSLHNPIVDLVADEIMRQVKKGGGSGGSVVEKGGLVQSHLILSDTSPSYLYDTRAATLERLNNSKDINYVATAVPPSGNASAKIYPVNTYQVQCSELPIQNHSGTSVPTQAFVPVAIQQTDNKNAPVENAKVVYPIETNFFSREVSKGEFPGDVFTTLHNGGSAVVQTLCQSNPSLIINVTDQSTLPTKIDYLTSLAPIPQSCPAEQDSLLKAKIDHHEEQMTMLQNGYKVLHSMQDHNPTLSLDQSGVKREEELLQNRRNSHMGKNISHEDTSFLEAPKISSTNIDTSTLTFKMENCDPLLSQANAVTTMTFHTADELSATLQVAGGELPHAQAASMMCQTSAANDIPISNFTESELLDYIIPTCFDNV